MLIIAHRGASAHAPENTLAAFKLALEAGVDGLEFDVQLAKDGVPVIFHDQTLERTAGIEKRIADLTSKQLSKTNVGSWFAPNYGGECVPSLELTLQFLSNFEGLIFVELKCELDNFKPLTNAVCEIIRNSPLRSQIILQSFRLAVIPEARGLLPDLQIAALFEPSITTLLRRREHLVAMARELGADQVSLHRLLATPNLCSLATDAGLPVTVWTVDNTTWIRRGRERSVRALITNHPARLIKQRDS